MTKLRWLRVYMGSVTAGHPFILRQGDEPYAYILQEWIQGVYVGETGKWVDIPVKNIEEEIKA